MELKACEAVRRLQALQTELEYSVQEETRRSEGWLHRSLFSTLFSVSI